MITNVLPPFYGSQKVYLLYRTTKINSHENNWFYSKLIDTNTLPMIQTVAFDGSQKAETEINNLKKYNTIT